MDDAHFGPPLDPTPEQARNVTPYRADSHLTLEHRTTAKIHRLA